MKASQPSAMLMEDFFPFEYESISFLRFIQKWKKYGSALMLLKDQSKISELTRPYLLGDSISKIDWRAFARTDQLIIREERQHAQQQITFFLDASSSMFFPEKLDSKELYNKEKICQKIDLAVRILIHLVGSHLKSSDQVDIYLIKDNSFFSQNHSLFSPRTLQDLFDFYQIISESFYDLKSVLSFFSEAGFEQKKTDLYYLISDGFFFGEEAKKDFFFKLKQDRPFVFLQILNTLEQDFAWLKTSALYHEEVSKKMDGRSLLNKDYLTASLITWNKCLQEKIKEHFWIAATLTEKTSIDSYFSFLESFFIRR